MQPAFSMSRGGTFLARQRSKPSVHLLAPLAVGEPRLNLATQRYRVLDGGRILGHFSNLRLVMDEMATHPNATVLDVSMCPHRVLCKEGKWAGMVQ